MSGYLLIDNKYFIILIILLYVPISRFCSKNILQYVVGAHLKLDDFETEDRRLGLKFKKFVPIYSSKNLSNYFVKIKTNTLCIEHNFRFNMISILILIMKLYFF